MNSVLPFMENQIRILQVTRPNFLTFLNRVSSNASFFIFIIMQLKILVCGLYESTSLLTEKHRKDRREKRKQLNLTN